ncbi:MULTISPECIES: SUMF1/EgtB/PvdO family nonheme iron enzyme [unclassified Paenibacillus]|uniref:formylglycine-generating enzyme family protein n=1 Tax=unclassified Paenibacillus TaxID=185978 RepID=UPI002404C09E|nr:MULTISPECIES: SUMF1/EgtB/PvdO family nonheme iron enzyme [unclassified Paenibacillus]MDF9840397.1 sulfatase modifying factor 1 [Paenibacillus sp. PastF-2]MDF9846979.1 sulfatase modifying factor 1 [Paenibacillus sp. PastM-2]MDF9853551.1 sulfatase modifying factor 1 [Paenibacillus sp. PastF-1]MDH6478963.1 sulfatase modifying factor 1 [Paenibacillus sp. PastH-2]MDH6506695.1 sulfatase modifying factor 1 [Paenibacillus sp. PastM-3]
MSKLWIIPAITLLALLCACSQQQSPSPESKEASLQEDSFVFVQGGSFISTMTNYAGHGVSLSDFYIGKYEVTQQEWMEVMGGNPSLFKGSRLPVEMVSWYDAVEYCNKRSIQEGFEPYYVINKETPDPANKSVNDTLKWTITPNAEADGYRLPTEAEWEYAASGGRLSQSYTYSGSNTADDVAWYWRNAGDRYLTGDWLWPVIEQNNNRTKIGGGKRPNELGLYDMSGNVREWCWDWYSQGDAGGGIYRIVKGGGWIGDVSNNAVSFRGKFEASGYGPDQGFRVVHAVRAKQRISASANP